MDRPQSLLNARSHQHQLSLSSALKNAKQLRETDPAAAAALLRDLAERHPEDPRPLLHLGDVAWKGGRKVEAAGFYSNAGRLGAIDLARKVRIAAAALESGDHGTAKLLYREVLEEDAGNNRALLKLGDLAHREKDLQTVIACYRAADLSAPRNHFRKHRLGCAHLALKEARQAASVFSDLVGSCAGDARSWGRLGDAYLMAGELEEAAGCYRNSITLAESDRESLYRNYANTLTALGRGREAREAYRVLQERFSDGACPVLELLSASEPEKLLETERLANAERKTQFQARLSADPPLISIVAATCRPELVSQLINSAAGQTYPNIELILVLHGPGFLHEQQLIERAGIRKFNIIPMGSVSNHGECLQAGVAAAAGGFIAIFDDDDVYAPNYLSGLYQDLLESSADIVGKTSYFMLLEATGELLLRNPGTANIFAPKVAGGSLFFKRELLQRVRWPNLPTGSDTEFQRSCRDAGFVLYGSDEFDYLVNRRSDKNSHTWKISDEALRRGALLLGAGGDKRMVYTAPADWS